jgi:phage terminase small subunit
MDKFCLAYLETGNASEAYCRAYNAKNSGEATVNVNAKKLLDSTKIALRLKELRAPILERHKITIDDLIKNQSLFTQ